MNAPIEGAAGAAGCGMPGAKVGATAGVGYDDYGILCVFNSDNISNADTLKKYNEKWQTVPAVITENFFQDVLDDAEYIAGNMDVIAGVIVSGIMDYLDNKTTWVENSEAFLNA